MNKEIYDYLEKIFTKQQAQVYMYLLDNPGQTVYQIAKSLEMSRSTVYPIVESMYNKGYLLKVAGDSQCFYSEKPDNLIKNLRNNYNNTFDTLDELLKNYEMNYDSDYFININSYDANIIKAKEILLKSKKEIYMNTDIDIEIFDNEIKELAKKGVKIFLFCFRKQNCNYENVEYYSYNKTQLRINTRLMIVSDLNIVLTAGSLQKENWIGTITNNHLMINIISEHIHHDIYLYKLQNEFETSHFFSRKSSKNIYINSENERRSFIKDID